VMSVERNYYLSKPALVCVFNDPNTMAELQGKLLIWFSSVPDAHPWQIQFKGHPPPKPHDRPDKFFSFSGSAYHHTAES